MEQVNSLVKKLYQSQSEETRKPEPIWTKTMMMVWRGLQAMKLVHDEIGSTDFKYWEASLFDYPEEQLLQGLKAAEDWSGFLTLGDFRKLCDKPTRAPYHSEFKALPNKPMDSDVFKARMKKMREELQI
jgi:hypothetical protein